MHDSTGSYEGWYDSSAPHMPRSSREQHPSSDGWVGSRLDSPMPAPRTRPRFSGQFPQFPSLQLASLLPRQSANALALYAVSGVAAMALGVYSSSALVPLFEAPDAPLPLSRHSEWHEDAPPAHAVDAAIARKSMRRPAVIAAKSKVAAPKSTGSKAYTRTADPVAAFDPNAEPDLDLMDIPSSPMEQRALAERGHAAVVENTWPDPSAGRAGGSINPADALSKLDLIRDPGAATGTIHINSRPWARVFVDERAVGVTPLLALPISTGPHRVRLVNEGFGMSKTLDLNVAAGEHVTRVVSLDE